MKTPTLFFFLFLLTWNGYAQLTIQANEVFTLGARFQVNNDFLIFSEIDSGLAGPNRVYDFTNLEAGPVFDTLSIVEASQSPFGNPFPEANRVVLRNNGRRDSWFLKWQNVGVDALGNVGSNPNDPSYQILPKENLIKFPVQFGDTASGMYTSPVKFYVGMPLQTPYVVDSVRRKTTVLYHWKIDGWGQVRTPFGTFPCLRQRIFRQKNDTADFLRRDLNVWVNGAETSSVQEVHFWYWTPAFPFPVVRLGDLGWNGFINDVEFVVQNLVTENPKKTEVHEPQIRMSQSNSNEIMVKFFDPLPASVQVFSLSGKKISNQKSLNGMVEMELHAQPGVYIIRLMQGNQVWNRKIFVH